MTPPLVRSRRCSNVGRSELSNGRPFSDVQQPHIVKDSLSIALSFKMPQQSDGEKQPIASPPEQSACSYDATSAFQDGFSLKLAAISFYLVTSILLTGINRSILLTHQFPAFTVIALGQMLTTVVVMHFLKRCNKIEYPELRFSTFDEIFPLPVLYAGGLLLSLSTTQKLNLPTSTSLRRLCIPMTMLAEYYILGICPGLGVQISVLIIVLGGIIAAADDLKFDLSGYLHVMCANCLSAYRGVCLSEKLDKDTMGKYGLVFYCSFFMLPVVLFIAYYCGDLALAYSYSSWLDPYFLMVFVLSCVLGFVLDYSSMVCTQYNSALTVSIVCCFKNILITYWGIFAGDYIFSWVNFIGVNLSVFGSVLCTYLTVRPTEKQELLISVKTESEEEDN